MMYFWLILGLLTLVFSGEFLVRGAVGIAKKFQISTLVIGMTVISFGTSAPELIVSINAALSGHPEIAIGNVIGSNIANLALVLGITVLILPMVVDRNTKRIDYPMMLLATMLFAVFALDGIIVFYEGVILFTILVTFTILLIRNSRKKTKLLAAATNADGEIQSIQMNMFQATGYLALGLVGLYFGAGWLVDGASSIAIHFGMEERVIGVTVVAFGTSAPELITSAVAAYRKEADISIGNLIGSNIFNIMAVIGITAMVSPIAVSEVTIHTDLIWMIAIALSLLPMMLIGKKIGRLKGVMLLSSYIVYISLLLLTF